MTVILQRLRRLQWALAELILLSALLFVSSQDPHCQEDGKPPYTGFSLKVGTGCSQYVYCQDGIVTSTNNCPGGLLFNGGVGIGGVCDWATFVPCNDGADSLGAIPEDGPGSSPNSIPESADNLHHHFCGSSRQNAIDICFPCPSGSLKDCIDPTHGCFRGVTQCVHDAPDPTDLPTPAPVVAQAVTAAMPAAESPLKPGFMLMPVPGTQGFLVVPEDQPTPPNPLNSPNAPVSPSEPISPSAPMSPSEPISPSAPTVPSPTLPSPTVPSPAADPGADPTLPPWTNAPFVSYKGSNVADKVTGYYASWQWYDRNKMADPANMDFSKYSRITYAFFQPDKKGYIFGTDFWGDPQLLWGPYEQKEEKQKMSGPDRNYFCSWDDPPPKKKNCNYHQTKKGLLYLAKAAGAQVFPSIGGWTLSDNYPTVAASKSARENFATQCVKLIEEYGFDGIDIDWEYPGFDDHSGTPEDTENFNKLLTELRDKLDMLGKAKGKYFPLTAALPCGPDNIANLDVGYIKDVLDELNLMSYDLHGAWDELTGTNAPMFDQGWTDKTPRWSIHGCVNNYVDLGVPLSKMNIGLPFYGRSFRTATGMKQVHDGPDDINFKVDEGSPQYFNIVNELHRMKTARHEKTQTQVAWFPEGGVVSYDDPRAICDKVDYAINRGLNGFLIWEISGDLLEDGRTPLIDATNEKIKNPSKNCADYRDPVDMLGSDKTYYYTEPEPAYVDMAAAKPLNPTPSAPSPPLSYIAPNGLTPPNPPHTAPKPFTTNELPGPSDTCPKDYTGYWPADKCTAYMFCSDGKLLGAKQSCIQGMFFDAAISVCTHATHFPECLND